MQARITAAGIVALVSLLLMDLVAGAVAPRLDQPQEWWDPTAAAHIEHMRSIEAAGARSQLVVVGSSMARDNIRVDLLAESLSLVEEAHNAGLAGADVTVVRRWLSAEVVPRLQPERVVWAVSSLDFNPNRVGRSAEGWDGSRATATGFYATVDRVLGKVSNLSEYRNELRAPAALLRLGDGSGPGSESLSAVTNRTGSMERGQDPGQIRDQMLLDYRIGEQEAAAFRDGLLDLVSVDIAVIVVVQPVPGDYVKAHPRGRDDYADFRAAVTRIAATAGVPVLDYSSDFTMGDFADALHMNETGATAFTSRLANDLSRYGW